MSNATNSEDRLESILDQIRVLKAKYDERAEVTGENFNVFSILDRESDEVKTHSAFIAELLNPHGSHSQRTLFLKLFLEKLLKKLQEEQKVQKELEELRKKLDQIKDDEFDKFKVEVETSKKNKEGEALGRIDILIESNDVCIVIENKIYAEDQPRQLGRYYEYALDTGKKRGIVYLTLLGDEPGEFTLYGKPGEDKIPLCRKLPEDTVVCLSYKEFIVTWVNDCIKEVVRIPQIRETLHQYQMLLKELTGQPINRRYAMALKDILLKDENYNLIPDVEAAISEAKDAFQRDFWTKLEEQLKAQLNIEAKNLRYEVDGRAPGLTFRFSESANEAYEVVFRIADDRDQYPLYYGFALREKGSHKRVAIDNTEHEKYITPYQDIIDDGEKNWDGGWIAYKYIKNPAISFTNFTFVTNQQERNREDFIKEELVKKLIKDEEEVCKVIKKIS